VTTVRNLLEFLVYNCHVTTNGAQIDIIDNSCFADTLSAKMFATQNSKVAEITSRFQYRAFIGGQPTGADNGSELTCAIKLCLKTDSCSKWDNGAPGNGACPNRPDYSFRRFG